MYNEEEKALIEQAYQELHADDPVEEVSDEGDSHEECAERAQQLENKINALATVIEAIVIKIGWLEEQVVLAKHTIDVDLIEGARKVAKATGRRMKIVENTTKYHDKFKDYEDAYKGADWGDEGAPDLYEQLTDILDEIKMSPEYHEGAEDETVEGLLTEFKGRFPDVGKPKEEVKPAELSEEEKARQNAIDYVNKFREAAKRAKDNKG
jgi:hypothetical protein